MNFQKNSKYQVFNLKIYVADLDLKIGLFQHESDTKGTFRGMFSTNYHIELLYYMHLMGNRII